MGGQSSRRRSREKTQERQISSAVASAKRRAANCRAEEDASVENGGSLLPVCQVRSEADVVRHLVDGRLVSLQGFDRNVQVTII